MALPVSFSVPRLFPLVSAPRGQKPGPPCSLVCPQLLEPGMACSRRFYLLKRRGEMVSSPRHAFPSLSEIPPHAGEESPQPFPLRGHTPGWELPAGLSSLPVSLSPLGSLRQAVCASAVGGWLPERPHKPWFFAVPERTSREPTAVRHRGIQTPYSSHSLCPQPSRSTGQSPKKQLERMRYYSN